MPITTAAAKRATGKSEVKKVIEDFMAALCKKDIKKMMVHYAAEVVMFDVKPPFQQKGAVTWRHVWEACIDYFPTSFKVKIRDLVIHVSDDLAVSHYLFRLTGADKDHPAMQTWIRTTTAFKKIQGKWKIIHEHGSLPINPHTAMAIFTLEL